MYSLQVLENSAKENIWNLGSNLCIGEASLTLWRRIFFFLILAQPVYKMWIIQEPNKLALWNKLHFEEKKRRV